MLFYFLCIESTETYLVDLVRRENERFGLYYDQNNIISALVMGTPAQSSAKIRVGDKICAINGESVASQDETDDQVAKAGTEMTILIKRIGNVVRDFSYYCDWI